MRFLLFAAIALILVAAIAQAQDSKNATYEKPAAYQYTTSRCLEYQVKSLYAATELSQSLEEQEKLLNAAEAYSHLAELNQPC